MKRKIFLVEDDLHISDVIQEYLEDAEFSVRSFSDGQEALDAIETSPDVDLYIFDIMLPHVSGFDLLECARKKSDAPILIITALNDELTALTSFNKLADDYVTKPFSPRVLIKRVEALLRRKNESFTKITVKKNVQLNFERREATQQGEIVELTNKEWEILRILILNDGRILSRQQILDLVWGYDYIGEERVIDVHIKNIRKKLYNDVIQTVKGVGYKIDE